MRLKNMYTVQKHGDTSLTCSEMWPHPLTCSEMWPHPLTCSEVWPHPLTCSEMWPHTPDLYWFGGILIKLLPLDADGGEGRLEGLGQL